MHRQWLALLAVPAAALLAQPLAAHHSVRGTYDPESLVSLSGTIRSSSWVNPHVRYTIETTDAAGKAVEWMFEIGAPNALIRMGLARDFLVVGDQVTLEVWTARDGTPNAHARTITFADGRRIELPEDRWMEGSASAPLRWPLEPE